MFLYEKLWLDYGVDIRISLFGVKFYFDFQLFDFGYSFYY